MMNAQQQQDYLSRSASSSTTSRLLGATAADHHLHSTATAAAAAAGVLLASPGAAAAATFLHHHHHHHHQRAADHHQSATGFVRTGLPELGRTEPPHATPASTPPSTPHCQGRYMSSLSVNTGSNYAFLHGGGAMTAGAMPSPISSPFRAPSMRHHWSHTPPPPPLESHYGRYGIGPNLYSLFPMMAAGSTEANPYCLSSSAARLMRKTMANPYHHHHHLFDATRELSLYHHHAGVHIGTAYSPTLAVDPLELSAATSLNVERSATPLHYIYKNAIGGGGVPPPTTSSSSSPLRESPASRKRSSSPVDVDGYKNGYDRGKCREATKETAAGRTKTSSDNKRLKLSKESVEEGRLLRTATSPAYHSSHPRNAGSKTMLSPPTANMAPVTTSDEDHHRGDAATIFKMTIDAAIVPTAASDALHHRSAIQYRLNVGGAEMPKLMEAGHCLGSKYVRRDAVKEEVQHKVTRCNTTKATEKLCVTNDILSPSLTYSKTDLECGSTSSGIGEQAQALNLSQSGHQDTSEDVDVTGMSSDDQSVDGVVTKSNDDQKKDGQMRSDRFFGEVPMGRLQSLCCDNNTNVNVKREKEDVLTYDTQMARAATAPLGYSLQSTLGVSVISEKLCADSGVASSSLSSSSTKLVLEPGTTTDSEVVSMSPSSDKLCVVDCRSSGTTATKVLHSESEKDRSQISLGKGALVRPFSRPSPSALVARDLRKTSITNPAKRIEAIVTLIASNKNNKGNVTVATAPPISTSAVSDSAVSSSLKTVATTTPLLDKSDGRSPVICDSKSDVSPTPSNESSNDRAAGMSPHSNRRSGMLARDALQVLRAHRDASAEKSPIHTTLLDVSPLDVSLKKRNTESSSLKCPVVVGSNRISSRPFVRERLEVGKPLHLLKTVKGEGPRMISNLSCIQQRWVNDGSDKPEDLSQGGVRKQTCDSQEKSCAMPIKSTEGFLKVSSSSSASGSFPISHRCQPTLNQWSRSNVVGSCRAGLEDQRHKSGVHKIHSSSFLDAKAAPLSTTSYIQSLPLNTHSMKVATTRVVPPNPRVEGCLYEWNMPYDLSVRAFSKRRSPPESDTGGAADSSSLPSPIRGCQAVVVSSSGMLSPPENSLHRPASKPTDNLLSGNRCEIPVVPYPSSSGDVSVKEKISKIHSDYVASAVQSKSRETCNKSDSDVVKKKNVAESSAVALPRLAKESLEKCKSMSSVKCAKSTVSCPTDSLAFTHPISAGASSIPVGIAVARQRQESRGTNISLVKNKPPSELVARSLEEPRSEQPAGIISSGGGSNNTNDNVTEHSSNVSAVSVSDFEMGGKLVANGGIGGAAASSCWDNAATKASNSLQTGGWMPTGGAHGPTVAQQTIWLGQTPYAAGPAPLSMQLGSLDHTSRQFPPLGYQLARDPISNHLFLFPAANIDLVDRPFVWPGFAATTSTAPATTAPQLPHNPFSQYIFQQQHRQLIQHEQARTLDFCLTPDETKQQEINKGVEMPQILSPPSKKDMSLDLMQPENVVCHSMKGESMCSVEEVKSCATQAAAISSSAPTPFIASIPVPGQTVPYVFSTSSSSLPYYYNASAATNTGPAATAVVHVAPEEAPVPADADKTSCGMLSPVTCSDVCRTPPSDLFSSPPSILIGDDNSSESDKKTQLIDDEDSEVVAVRAEPLMADACNQTETPPLTDDEDELDDDEGEDDDDDDENEGEQELSLVDYRKSHIGLMGTLTDDNSPTGTVVRQEDSGIQCELLSVKNCEFSSSSSSNCEPQQDEKKSGDRLATSGLELLSNTIQEHEESLSSLKTSSGRGLTPGTKVSVSATRNASKISGESLLDTSTPPVVGITTSNSDRVLFDAKRPSPECHDDKASGSQRLGGLGLLCALAEQRIMQETLGESEKRVEEAASPDVSDNIVSEENVLCRDEEVKFPDNEEDLLGSNLIKSYDDQDTIDNNWSYKGTKTQKEYKEFIAHKMLQYASPVTKSPQHEPSTMDAAEFEMRMRLAELQKKYKEKQKELARLVPKKDKQHADKRSTKRGPGRPRKRKLLALCAPKVSKYHDFGDSKGIKSRKGHALFDLQRSSSKKAFHFSRLDNRGTKGLYSRYGKQILKPAILNPKNCSGYSTSWLQLVTSPADSPVASDLATKSNFGGPISVSCFGKTNFKSSFLVPPCILPAASGSSLSVANSTVSFPEAAAAATSSFSSVETTPEDQSSETSDSDDSNSYTQKRSDAKRSFGTKAYKQVRRRDTVKSNKKSAKYGEDDDNMDLSLCFSSLSVSCTMPPFQGCEESSGLGMLARYASQVVEQTKSSKGNAATSKHYVGGDRMWSSDPEAFGSLSKTPRKRKPGRPKKHSPIKSEQATETIVAKKTKSLNFVKMDSIVVSQHTSNTKQQPTTTRLIASTCSTSTPNNASEAKYSFLEDEAWLRRRSERIFLNEPRINQQQQFYQITETMLSHKKSLASSSSCLLKSSSDDDTYPATVKFKSEDPTKSEANRLKKRPTKAKVDMELGHNKKLKPLQPTKQDNVMTDCDQRAVECNDVCKSDVGDSVVTELKENAADKEVEAAASVSSVPHESDSDNQETGSFSEGDNLPLSKLIERPTTPEPRSCVIQDSELRDRLRVLTMMDGLFYAGYINAIRAPDVYGIMVDGERGNRPHIYSREEILQEAIIEVKPQSMRYLSEGTRICAYWSQQYRCLYPGTVAKPTSPSSSPDNNSVYVEFDDGDSGRIAIDNTRLLPPDLPIISYDPDPLTVVKRRTKSTGDLSREKRPLVPLVSQEPVSAKSKKALETLRMLKAQAEESESIIEVKSECKPKNESKDTVPSISISPTKTTAIMNVTSAPAGATLQKVSCTAVAKIKETGASSRTIIVDKFDCVTKMPNESRVSTITTLADAIVAAASSVTTITSNTSPTASITVIPINGTSTSSEDLAAKGRRHKKHKMNDRHHHHHHHNHHHKHRHKHDDRVTIFGPMEPIISMTHVTNKNIPVVDIKRSTVVMMAENNDMKKSELTLTIKTNNSTDLQAENKTNGSGIFKKWSPSLADAAPITREASSIVGPKNTSSGSSSSSSGSSSSSSEDEENEAKPQCKTSVELVPAPQQPVTTQPTKKGRNVKDDAALNVGSNPNPQKNVAKPKKGRERTSSTEPKSKIAAFLPARQLWKWSGKSFRRPGTKGKAKKEFYKSITRGRETIRVGDSAVFLSTGRPHLPYIGRIETMWESWGGNMVVKVKWFYHPEETKGGRKLADTKGALYQSLHEDENDVQTISHKCEVLSWAEYRQHKEQEGSHHTKYYDNNDVYYLAGTYDPMTGAVTLEPGVS